MTDLTAAERAHAQLIEDYNVTFTLSEHGRRVWEDIKRSAFFDRTPVARVGGSASGPTDVEATFRNLGAQALVFAINDKLKKAREGVTPPERKAIPSVTEAA